MEEKEIFLFLNELSSHDHTSCTCRDGKTDMVVDYVKEREKGVPHYLEK